MSINPARYAPASNILRTVFGCFLFNCPIALSAEASCKVAVIDGGHSSPINRGESWCNFLNENGYDCTLFPISGPTANLDPFQIILDCSQEWPDSSGLLADQLRAGKTVITWGEAPQALGIQTNTNVQAWIGASTMAVGSGKLFTVALDPIFGPMAPGGEVDDCAAAVCTGLQGSESYSNAIVLALWNFGSGPAGIIRNSWEGGQSFYLPSSFATATPGHSEIMLRIMQIYCRPIPALSIWGVVLLGLLMIIIGTLILRRRMRAIGTALFAFCAAMPLSQAAQIPPQSSILLSDNNGMNELRLNSQNERPFHITRQNVQNAKLVEIDASENLIILWDQIASNGTVSPWYAISLDGAQVDFVTQTSNQLNLRFATFDPAAEGPDVPPSLLADSSNDVYLLQLVAQPITDCRDALESVGTVILAYIPENSLVVKMDTSTKQQALTLGFVRSIAPFHAAYRLEEDLIGELTSETARL